MKDFLGETGDELVNEGLASYMVVDNGGWVTVACLIELSLHLICKASAKRTQHFLSVPFNTVEFGNIVSLSTQVYKIGIGDILLGVTLRWTGIPSRRNGNALFCFMLQKPG